VVIVNFRVVAQKRLGTLADGVKISITLENGNGSSSR
jgi:hypothetical protein